jgi:hypothetical protein
MTATARCAPQNVQAVPSWHDSVKNRGIFPLSSYGQRKTGRASYPSGLQLTDFPTISKTREEIAMKRRPVSSSRAQCEGEEFDDGPRLGLGNRQNKAIRFLDQYYPEPQPTSVIPGVSDITMEGLIARDVVAEVQAPGGKERVFILAARGEDEVRRLKLQETSLRNGIGKRRPVAASQA